MKAIIKNLKSYIDEFGDEIHNTHIAYVLDKDLAKQKAKKLINDIIENGLEEKQPKWSYANRESTKISYEQLCEKYTMITLEYISYLWSSELRWVLS